MLFLPDLRDGYVKLVNQVWAAGEPAAPRGEPTREVLNAAFELPAHAPTLPTGVGRRANPAVGAAEALQLVAGVSDPRLLARISPAFEQFTEDDGTLAGPYGPLLSDQLPNVIARLFNDPDTRRATATIWNPAVHGVREHLRDYPCTVALQFMVRQYDDAEATGGPDGQRALNLHVWMRSNDVWWGVAYDVFQFTQLQLSVARALGLPAGRYFHNAASLHLYDRDQTAARALYSPLDEYPHAAATGIGRDGDDWLTIKWRARRLLEGGIPERPTASELWYAGQLERHVR